MEFVDARQFRDRLASNQNHVVFGRRGAGKTSLVTATRDQRQHIDVYLNLEDYKDITFPNIVIRVVLELFEALLVELHSKYPWYKFSRKARPVKHEVMTAIAELKSYLREPDTEVQEVNEMASYDLGLNTSVKDKGLTAGATAIGRSRSPSPEITQRQT